jgi:hypothetical protein
VTPCPHCHSLAQLEPSPGLRWRCAVCGAPVVPVDAVGGGAASEAVARSNAELPSLVAAQRLRAIALGWTAGAVVFAATGLMALGLALLLWAFAHVAAFVLGALAVAAGVFSAMAWARAKARRAEVRGKLEEAWERVADEVVRARGDEITAAELARTMRTDEPHAEALLSRLSAGGRVRVAVRDDADLAYRVAEDAPVEPPAAEGTSRANRG